MSLQGTIHRYSLILDYLGKRKYPAFKEVCEHLNDRGFEVSDRTVQRDIERHGIRWLADPEAPTAPRVNDLWAKSAWLSTHEDDRSLRVRLSFGREGPEDAARGWMKVGRALQALLLEAEAEGLASGFVNQAIEVPSLRPA